MSDVILKSITNLCLLIGAFKTFFTFYVSIDILDLKSAILCFCFFLSVFHFSVVIFLPSCELLKYVKVFHIDLSVVFLGVFLCITFLVVSVGTAFYIYM